MTLSDSDLGLFKARLQLRRADLAAAIEARLHRHGFERHAEASLPQRSEDTDDDAAANTQREADIRQLARLSDALARVEAALHRVDEGDYGICVDCGCEIDDARLHANPEAERCVGCQTAAEHRAARSA